MKPLENAPLQNCVTYQIDVECEVHLLSRRSSAKTLTNIHLTELLNVFLFL